MLVNVDSGTPGNPIINPATIDSDDTPPSTVTVQTDVCPSTGGDCCVCPSPGSPAGTPCVCIQTGSENSCVSSPNNGVWVGPNGCVPGTTQGCEGNTCDGGGGCEIPEFSTIALPVASILGLLFFFNYRKRKREQ